MHLSCSLTLLVLALKQKFRPQIAFKHFCLNQTTAAYSLSIYHTRQIKHTRFLPEPYYFDECLKWLWLMCFWFPISVETWIIFTPIFSRLLARFFSLVLFFSFWRINFPEVFAFCCKRNVMFYENAGAGYVFFLCCVSFCVFLFTWVIFLFDAEIKLVKNLL